MINARELEKILNIKKNLHPNDPSIYKVWEALTEIFSESEENTISYLMNCSEEDLKSIHEVFDDISERLKSERFIAVLEHLNEKYPDLKMDVDIQYAKKCLD